MRHRCGRVTRCKLEMSHAATLEGQQNPYIGSVRGDGVTTDGQALCGEECHPRFTREPLPRLLDVRDVVAVGWREADADADVRQFGMWIVTPVKLRDRL